jgi:hypothetical protein
VLDGWIDMTIAPLNVDFINMDSLTDLILECERNVIVDFSYEISTGVHPPLQCSRIQARRAARSLRLRRPLNIENIKINTG